MSPLLRQATLDETGTPLSAVRFVVVDLETTGGRPGVDEITEVGAVRVRGGRVDAELTGLVRPDAPVPPLVTALTGISDVTLAGAPRLREVLPSLLELLPGSVLVAHNAPFDVGFLTAACRRLGLPWPDPPVVDTARLARAVVSREEARDCRLATLARLFRASTQPTHRALADARATVDVLHGLLERLGGLGVQTLEELRGYSSRVPEHVRRKRGLADDLPSGPGVYLFRGPGDEVLYVGTSGDVRTRVRTYFVASERRTRMAEMVGVAQRVDAVGCAHALEASVRELRLLAAHEPRYNRRSRRRGAPVFLALTREPFPRLAVVRRRVPDGGPYLGPFASRRAAAAVLDAVHDALPVRRCTARLSPARRSSPCALAGLGRCGAPCDGGQDVLAYGRVVEQVRAVLEGDPAPALRPLAARVEALAAAGRYEAAASLRDGAASLVRAAARCQSLSGLGRCPELLAARPGTGGAWDLALVRSGRLTAAARVPRGGDVRAVAQGLHLGAEVVEAPPDGLPGEHAEEVGLVARWLAGDGARLVRCQGAWTSRLPAAAAPAHAVWTGAAERSSDQLRAREDRRGLRPRGPGAPARAPRSPGAPPARAGAPPARARVGAVSPTPPAPRPGAA